MKVIKHPNDSFRHWWIDLKIECDECKSIFQLESSDDPYLSWNQFIQFTCQFCGNELTINRNTVEVLKTCLNNKHRTPDVFGVVHTAIMNEINKHLNHYVRDYDIFE